MLQASAAGLGRSWQANGLTQVQINIPPKRQRLQELIKRLSDDRTELCFEVNEISLISRNDPPEDEFQVANSIPLKPDRL